MDEKTNKNVIILLSLGGLIGGVALYFLKLPSVIVSLFLGIAVATITYHFLGGISAENQVAWGKIKLTGSAAVLVVVTLLLNKSLAIRPPDIQTMFNPSASEWIPLNENGSPVKIEIKNIGLKDPLSIEPKKDLLRHNMLTIYKEGDRYHVAPEGDKTFVLGNLTQSVFSDLGFFQNVASEKGMLYRTGELRAGTKGATFRNFLTGRELPFKITTGDYGNELSGYHLIDDNGKELHQGELGVLQGEVVKVENRFYLIFILRANHSLGPEASFAQFGGYLIDLR